MRGGDAGVVMSEPNAISLKNRPPDKNGYNRSILLSPLRDVSAKGQQRAKVLMGLVHSECKVTRGLEGPVRVLH